jgi:hypothetical protein
MDLSRDYGLGVVRSLANDTGLTLGGKCSGFFLAEGVRNSYPSFLAACNHDNR